MKNIHYPHKSGCRSANSRKGFSLVELLLVISIILILSAVVVTSFGGFNRSVGARGATDLFASLSHAARFEAMSMGLGAVLAVDNGADPKYRYRRIGLFRYVPDPNNPANKILQPVGAPVLLQQNTYFLKNYSDGFFAMTIDFPTQANNPVFAYKYTGTGHLDDSQKKQDVRLVFSPGPLDDNGDPVSSTVAATRAGLLLRKNGRPTFLTVPDQMPLVP